MIVVWVPISLSGVIENIGDICHLMKRRLWQFAIGQEVALQAESSPAKRTTDFACLWGRT